MGMTATIKRAINALFRALGDIVKPATYHSVGTTSTWDADAGKMVYPATPYTLKRVAFVRFQTKEIDKDPTLKIDRKAIFPRDDLPVEPKTDDWMTDEKGRIWHFVERMEDPIDGVAILRMRMP